MTDPSRNGDSEIGAGVAGSVLLFEGAIESGVVGKKIKKTKRDDVNLGVSLVSI